MKDGEYKSMNVCFFWLCSAWVNKCKEEENRKSKQHVCTLHIHEKDRDIVFGTQGLSN